VDLSTAAAAPSSAGTFIPGIAQALPPGERLLWWGKPVRSALATHVFHVRVLAVYFVAMIAVWALNQSGQLDQATFLRMGLILTGVSALAIGLLVLYAHLTASATVYAITDRRVVMKIGVAFDLTLNIPLHYVQEAALRTFRDGTGQIALSLPKEQRLGYVILWPHARAWRVTRPEPALRGLSDPAAVGAVLQQALSA
jgi:hypothetical protein